MATGMAAVSALVFTFLSRRPPRRQRGVLCGLSRIVRPAPPPLRHRGEAGRHERRRPGRGPRCAPTRSSFTLRRRRIRSCALRTSPRWQGCRRRGHPAGGRLHLGGPDAAAPAALGADYVIHSLTKYLNGHGDALGGAVLGPQRRIQRIRQEMLVHLGGALSPFNAWLILRGLATLPLRMAKHCRNAPEVARFLAAHPRSSAWSIPASPATRTMTSRSGR